MIVPDASALVHALVDAGPLGARARDMLAADPDMCAPHVVDLEVTSALRSLVRRGRLSPSGAGALLVDLAELPARRFDHRPLVGRIWALRDALSAYDAAYVALAEALGASLVTGDARLARAPGIRCRIALVEA